MTKIEIVTVLLVELVSFERLVRETRPASSYLCVHHRNRSQGITNELVVYSGTVSSGRYKTNTLLVLEKQFIVDFRE